MKKKLFKFNNIKSKHSICVLFLTTIVRKNKHLFQIFHRLTFKNKRSNRKRQCKFQTIFENLRQFQSKRLIRLFFYNEIRNQFQQKRIK